MISNMKPEAEPERKVLDGSMVGWLIYSFVMWVCFSVFFGMWWWVMYGIDHLFINKEQVADWSFVRLFLPFFFGFIGAACLIVSGWETLQVRKKKRQ
ncbi:hypothetical protein [Jannaschia sp. LMIT008]|uniref:hypothetical protein n=1 Tax=Jannaschia maritima TaxID=3032585 RepID=UPI002810C85E|nr:hypothetical protein [Jannaschia sp. LMIT008]